MVVFHDLQPFVENNILDVVDHSFSIQVNFSSNRDMDVSVKVSLLFFTVILSWCVYWVSSIDKLVLIWKFKAEMFCLFFFYQVTFFPNFMLQGMLQQLQVTFDVNILLNLLEFYGVFTSFKFYNERVCTIFIDVDSFVVFPPFPAFRILKMGFFIYF